MRNLNTQPFPSSPLGPIKSSFWCQQVGGSSEQSSALQGLPWSKHGILVSLFTQTVLSELSWEGMPGPLGMAGTSSDPALVLSDFQNFLRTQMGNTTTVNVIISTVDYLLRLQVSGRALDNGTSHLCFQKINTVTQGQGQPRIQSDPHKEGVVMYIHRCMGSPASKEYIWRQKWEMWLNTKSSVIKCWFTLVLPVKTDLWCYKTIKSDKTTKSSEITCEWEQISLEKKIYTRW